jgi:hypothetical protein
MRIGAIIAITLSLGIAGSAAAVERPERGAWQQAPRPPDAGDPDPSGSEVWLEQDRTTQLERLMALEEKDPAGFRDLLRRSLTARLLWGSSGRPLPPDFPVELARP